MTQREFNGAWMTDIDDTLVESGEMPGDSTIDEIADFVRVLKKHGVMWVPMSGVAIVKLGPRILYRLPEDVLDNIIYYGGDGSLKYVHCMSATSWKEDKSFSRLFTDEQAYMILGDAEYRNAYLELHPTAGGLELESKVDRIRESVGSLGYDPDGSVLDMLRKELQRNGIDPGKSETYFRGGSVSWMMLGDVSADPYHTDENTRLRKRLIEMGQLWLEENNGLANLGSTGIHVPFPGARGIKFVLHGNDKERSARDLIREYSLKPERILFSGNELFGGGNDNMIRNIDGVLLLSVGSREDGGPWVVNGRLKTDIGEVEGVRANQYWMRYVMDRLATSCSWESILKSIQEQQ